MRMLGLSCKIHIHVLSQSSNFAYVQDKLFLSCNSLTVSPIKTPIRAANDDKTVTNEVLSKGSGTTARGRRLLKVREEKRKREYEKLHTYPVWAK